MIKTRIPLSKTYGLDKLKGKNDSVDVSFKLISGENAFRKCCSLFANDNGFSVSVNKGSGSFKVTRLN